MNKISVLAFGHATSLFVLVTYLLCIVFDLLLPNMAIHTVWQRLLPGFEWLTLKGFLVGAVGAYLYGWYIAVIWVPMYNFFSAKDRNPNES